MTETTLRTLGAYPIKHHRDCAERSRLDLTGPTELKAPYPDALLTRMSEGVAFEARNTSEILDALERLGWQVVRVLCDGSNIPALPGGKVAVNLELACGSDGARTDEAKKSAEQATIAAMRAGVSLIFGGRILADFRVGEPDILIADVDGTYLGADMKDHKCFEGDKTKPKPYLVSDATDPFYPSARTEMFPGRLRWVDDYQLVHYWYLLDSVGFAGRRVGAIFGREGVLVWRDLDALTYDRGKRSAFSLYDETLASLRVLQADELDRVKNNPARPPLSEPVWTDDCANCEWRVLCKDELKRREDISLLPGVTRARRAAHVKVGNRSIRSLAALHGPTARLIDAKVDVPALMERCEREDPALAITTLGLDAHVVGALAQEDLVTVGDVKRLCADTARYANVKPYRLMDAIDQARVQLSQHVHRARGVDSVQIERAYLELDFDIEDDSSKHCYLIGVKETTRRPNGVSRSTYLPFTAWERSPQAEAENFARFWAYVQRRLEVTQRSKRGTMRMYCYSRHEERFFEAMARRHAGTPGVPSVDEVAALVRSRFWVDMYPIVSQQLIWPTESLTLKALASWCRFSWRDEAPGGGNSVAWYREALATADTDPARSEELRQRLLAYNEDDVIATYTIREWLSRLGAARKPGDKLPAVDKLESLYCRR